MPGQTNLEQPGQVGRLARRGVSANCLLARNGMAITIGTTGQLAVAPLCSGCPPSSPALSIYLSTMCLRSFLVNILERRGGARRAQSVVPTRSENTCVSRDCIAFNEGRP